MKKIYIVTIVVGTLFIVGLALSGSITLIDNRTFASEERAIYAANQASMPDGAPISLRANGQGKSQLGLGDGREMATVYVGAEAKRELENRSARPLALAAGDVDEDGVPDLVSGYASDDANLLVIHRGNVDAIYADTPEANERKARGEFTDAPFLSPARVFELPERPDLIGTGDFNADGHRDVVVAALGSQRLYWLAGDGHGGLGDAQTIELPGKVTAMTVGEINRADGLDDVIVGISGEQGSQALIFEGAEGALKSEPEVLTLPHAATSLALGQLDDGYEMDLGVAAGRDLLIVHGRDRRLSLGEEERSGVKAAEIEHHEMPFNIASVAVGDFSGDPHSEVAMLSEDGVVHVLERAAVSGNWSKIVGEIATGCSTEVSATPALMRARVSVSGKDDLLLVDRGQRQVQVITSDALKQRGSSAETGTDSAAPLLPETLDVDGEIAAVIPMRLNKYAFNGLVMLKNGGEGRLAFAPALPLRAFTVNSASDQNGDAHPGDGNCETGTGNGVCTLRAAFDEVNAGPGGDAISFSVSSITLNANRQVQKAVTIDGGGSRVEIKNGTVIMAAGNSTIRGLVINGIGTGIEVQSGGTGNSFIEGNYVGTDTTGSAIVGNTASTVRAIHVSAAQNNTIGGTTPAARNILVTVGGSSRGIAIDADASGNRVKGNYIGVNASGTNLLGTGIGIDMAPSSIFPGNSNETIGGTEAGAGNVISGGITSGIHGGGTGYLIQGNLIGTDAFGTTAIGNGTGIDLFSSGNQSATIGGTTPTARNIVSGNSVFGIGVGGSSILVQGNYIGTNRFGTNPLSNAQAGVSIQNNATGNIIGGTASGSANTIAFNATGVGYGIVGPNNSVARNSIFGNTGTGISSGAKAPALTTAGQGTLTGATPNASYTIEFFSNEISCGSSGGGQGKTYISSITVPTGANGNTLSPFTVPADQNVTATATAAGGNTSPFSNCVGVSDILTLDQIAPPASSNVTESDLKTAGLKAKVSYLLTSKPNALLALQVFDQDGFMIGSSVVEQKARPNPTPTPLPNQDFFIPGVQTDCPNATCSPIQLRKDATGGLLSKTLTMQAFFIDPVNGSVIKRSSTITYNVVIAVRLKGLEVTQVVQDLGNNVPLVADKATFIRAYVTPSDGQPPGAVISASLVGTNSGGVTSGRLTPSNRGKTIKLIDSPQRAVLQDSFYFELPADWRKAGTLQFRIESPDLSFDCAELDDVSDCAATVTFSAVKPFSVNYVLLTYKDAAGVSHTSTLADKVRTEKEILGLFPIDRFDSASEQSTSSYNFCLGDAVSGRMRRELNDLRIIDCKTGPCKDFYQGLAADQSSCSPATTLNGEGDLPGHASVVWAVTDRTTTRAHEQGHVLGLKHTDGGMGEKCGNAAGNTEPCTKLEGDGTLSSTKSQYTTYTEFGLDARNFSGTQIYPADTFDLMTYAETRWTSGQNYTLLFNKLKVGAALNEPVENANVVSAAQTVLIDGDVLLNGTGGSIGSVYISNTPGTVTLPNPGSYAIRFENAQGAELAVYPFDPILGSETPTLGIISLQLPWDTATRRIVLLHNGQVLATRQASANSPVVRVTSPNGGETLNGASTTFTWTASDQDGDSLTYLLEYSRDNGTTWKALAVNWTLPSFPVDLTNLPGSSQALFRVTASDGFNTTQDQSDAVFTVPAHGPQAFISTPDNNHIYVGDQTIILNGMGIDIEDGTLDSSRLSWSSSLNGTLGTGSSLAINALTLVEGTHTITLTATDSTGRVGTTTITIRVFRTAPVFPVTLAVGPTGLAFNATLGTVQSASQILAIRNNGDGALTWSATAGQPWIRLGSTSGSAPSNLSITANPTGLAPGQYTGNVTITSAGSVNSPQTVQVAFSVTAPVSVTVSGRVLTSDGRGLRNATVSITNSSNVTQFATTSSFGFFSFDNVALGQTYTVRISSRLFRFGIQTIQVNGNLTVPDFVGLE